MHMHTMLLALARSGRIASTHAADGGDGCGTVGGIDPCQVHSSIDWGQVQTALTTIVGHFGGIATAVAFGVAAVLGIVIAIRYMLANANARRIEAARGSFIRLIEGFALFLGVGLVLGVVTMVVKAAGA